MLGTWLIMCWHDNDLYFRNRLDATLTISYDLLSPCLNQLKYNNEGFTFRTHQTEMIDWDKHDRIVQHNCLFKNQLLGSLGSL